MRLWSINFRYLDQKGLCGLWRESLLAQNALLGKTVGYKNHPQLDRFKACDFPIRAIGQYLTLVYKEGINRGYKFDPTKIDQFYRVPLEKITVTKSQIIYEFNHLQDKLFIRDKKRYNHNFADIQLNEDNIETNECFQIVNGPIEQWEQVK